MGIIPWLVIVTTVAGVGGTGLGGVVSALIRRDSKKVVSLLLSFAGGIMLAIVCYDLVADAMATGGNGIGSLPLVAGGIILGFAVVALLNYLIDRSTNHEIAHIDEDHPQTADALDELIHSDHFMEHKKRNSELFSAGVLMACAIALHNLPEGMVIGAAFASDGGIEMSKSGLALAIVIGLHNIPEGMAVAVPLIAGGMGRMRAVWITALSGAPTVLGALLGYAVGALSPASLAISLSAASGAMLYVVFGELLPESILMWRSKLPALAVTAGMLVGMAVIYA